MTHTVAPNPLSDVDPWSDAALASFTRPSGPRRATENIPILVQGYDATSADPRQHAILGLRLPEAIPIRAILGPDRRENPSDRRPEVLDYATDPVVKAGGDPSLAVDLVQKNPYFKCFTPIGGIIRLKSAYCSDATTNTWTAWWLEKIGRTNAQLRIGPMLVDRLWRQSPLPNVAAVSPPASPRVYQAVQHLCTDRAINASSRDQFFEAIEAALSTEGMIGDRSFYVRFIKRINGQDICTAIMPLYSVRDRKDASGQYHRLSVGDAITAYRQDSDFARHIVANELSAGYLLEVIPVSRIWFGARTVAKTLTPTKGGQARPTLDKPYLFPASSIIAGREHGVAISSLGLSINRDTGATVATSVAPIQYVLYDLASLTTCNHDFAAEGMAAAVTEDQSDDSKIIPLEGDDEELPFD